MKHIKKESLIHYSTLGWLLLVTTPLLSFAEKKIPEKPNIVFLFADDWGKYAGCYKNIDGENTIHSVIETPHIDHIARQGIIFTNAHVPAPSCTPCRSSILSGQYFYKTGRGAILQGAVWDESIPSFPLILKENGYHIGFTYKVWSPGRPLNAPYGGEKYRYESAGNNFNQFSQYVSNREDKNLAKEELLEEVKQNFLHFLSDNKKDQPFCYWFGPTNTHRQWIQGSGKDIWGLDPDKLKGNMPTHLPDVPEIREDFNDYLGEVLAWDAAVGIIYHTLTEIGELENTLIVISGDHGIPGFPRAKTNLYDLGTQVALIIYHPKEYGKERIVHDFVNLMDLAPTFLEVAGVDIPDLMDGKSIVPVLESRKSGWIDPTRTFVMTGRERHVATARQGNLPYPQRAIRTKDFKYIRNLKPDREPIGSADKNLRDIDNGPTKNWFLLNQFNPNYQKEWELAFGFRPFEELYNVKEDPFEINNLADNPEYEKIRIKLAGIMDSIMDKTNDPRINNEDCKFDKMPYTIVSEREKAIQQRLENDRK